MNIEGLQFVRLAPNHEIKPFDCGDKDLNDYLFNDAKDQQAHLLSVTYLLESDEETIAFFSVLNDKISINQADSTNQWLRRIARKVPHNKRKPSYPSMKIGRLGVAASYQSKGHGTMIMDYIKNLFITNNRTGCRFITVDAYSNDKTIKFYANNQFDFLTKKDEKDDTRIMYYDLRRLLL